MAEAEQDLLEQLDGVYLSDTDIVKQHITDLEDTLNSYIYSGRYSNDNLEQQVNAWHDQLGFLVGATLSQLRRYIAGDITKKTFVQRMKTTLEGVAITPESVMLEIESEPSIGRTLDLIKYVTNLLKSRPPTLLWSCQRVPKEQFGKDTKSTVVERPKPRLPEEEPDERKAVRPQVPKSDTDRPTVSEYRTDMSSYEKSQAEAERRAWRIENRDSFENLYPEEISIEDGRDFVMKWLNAVEQPAPIVTLKGDMVSKGFTRDELEYVIDILYEDGMIDIREHSKEGVRDLYIMTSEFTEEREERIKEFKETRDTRAKEVDERERKNFYTLDIPEELDEPMTLEKGDDVIEFEYYSLTGEPFFTVYLHDNEGNTITSLTENSIHPEDLRTLKTELSGFELERETIEERDGEEVIGVRTPEGEPEVDLEEPEPLPEEEPDETKGISGMVAEELKDLSKRVSRVDDDEVEVETDEGIYNVFEVSDDLYRVTTPDGESYYFTNFEEAVNYAETGVITGEAYRMEGGQYIPLEPENNNESSSDGFAQQLEQAEKEYQDTLSEDKEDEDETDSRWFEDTGKPKYEQVTLGGRQVGKVCYDKMTPELPAWARKDYEPDVEELDEEIPICTISKSDIRLFGKRVIGDDGKEGLNPEQYTRVREGLDLYMNGKVRRIGKNEWVVYGSEKTYVIGLRHGEYVHLDTFKGDWWYRQSGFDNWCKHIVAVHIANELDCDIDHEDGWGDYSGQMNVVPPKN